MSWALLTQHYLKTPNPCPNPLIQFKSPTLEMNQQQQQQYRQQHKFMHHTMPLPYKHYQTQHLPINSNPNLHKSPSHMNPPPAQYHRLSTTANNHQLRVPHQHQPMRSTVISDISFESGLSDDYALPPDAVSESTCPMDASMPSLLMRQSYVDSPSKKLESLEKVRSIQLNIKMLLLLLFFFFNHLISLNPLFHL